MRKRLFVSVLAAVMLLALLGGCGQQQAQQSASSSESASASDAEARAKELVSSMTVEQKLAQMMIVGLRSDGSNTYTVQELTQEYADVLKKYDFGGVILFQGNMEDPKQTITLIRDIQQAAVDSEPGIPMFMALDEEGGMVSRVPFGVVGSGNMALQATGDPEAIKESSSMLGRSAASLGFNMNFAPVCDVNNNPTNPVGPRCFSDDAQIVADDVTIFLKAMQDQGICTSLKHFPGHGNVDTDSHTGLPSSDHTLEELKECELIPFQAGIKAGTDMIMTAHIQFPNIVKETYESKKDGKAITVPATLSHTIITDVLRGELGYDGIVITDDMQMGAVVDHFDSVDANVLAINAGVDILLGPIDFYKGNGMDTLKDADGLVQGLAKKVESGDISEERLNESVTRILKCKIEKGILDNTLKESAEDQLKKAEEIATDAKSLQADWDITQRAITLVKNDDGLLPLDGNDGKNTLVLYPVEKRQPTMEYVDARLQEKGLLAKDGMTAMCYAELKADDAALQEALKKASRVMFLSMDSERNEEMGKVIEQAHKDGKKVVLISLKAPCETAVYSEADAAMCAYQPYGDAHDAEGKGPFSMNVAVAMCEAFGEATPEGTLSVNVPTFKDGKFSTAENLYERGFGLKNWGKQ